MFGGNTLITFLVNAITTEFAVHGYLPHYLVFISFFSSFFKISRSCDSKVLQYMEGTGLCQHIVLKVMATNVSKAFFLS